MPNNEIVRRETTTGKVTIDGKPYHITLVAPPPASNDIRQLPDERPAHYTTAKSRGIPDQRLPQVELPSLNPLSMMLAAIASVLFLVGASMFSIALTSHSNSVDRYDRRHSQPTHKQF